jgi:hypothetical protein
MFFSFKTVGYLQVIHQPLYGLKQIRAGSMRLAEKLDWKGLRDGNPCLKDQLEDLNYDGKMTFWKI